MLVTLIILFFKKTCCCASQVSRADVWVAMKSIAARSLVKRKRADCLGKKTVGAGVSRPHNVRRPTVRAEARSPRGRGSPSKLSTVLF